jgi:hypothetical protein
MGIRYFFLLKMEKENAYIKSHTVLILLTWVTWLLIFIGPGGSALKMLLASVASARNVASV